MAANIWKGSISFGLLNIPVTLHTAQQDKDIHFSMLDGKDMSRIKYQKISATTGKEVPYDRIVKGYEYESGQYVIMEPEDFEKANVKAAKTIDIEDFVLLDEIDTLLFEKPYYLVPQKGAEKGYMLLREALERTKKVAIAKIVIRVKQHLAMIMPRGDYLVLEILRFAHQVKDVSEVDYLEDFKTDVKFSQRELKMAEDLIKGMTSKWSPNKYKDTYYEDLLKLIDLKVKKGKGYAVKEPSGEVRERAATNVVDLLPLLQKSIAATQKNKSAKSTGTKRRVHH